MYFENGVFVVDRYNYDTNCLHFVDCELVALLEDDTGMEVMCYAAL